jgi:glycosyltransferase involved in cell wall biosynthesis
MDPRKRIIAVSEQHERDDIKLLGSETIKKFTICLYNFSDQKDDSKSNVYHFGARKTILTLGHVIWYKNPEFWIKVIKYFNTHSQFKDYSWIWAGDGELLEICRKTITDKKIKNASFIGYIQNVETLYDQAVVYFQPSILESFGLSVLDAMQKGIPCVVTRAGGLPELVVDGENGFIIEEGDIKGAVEKISWLLTHPEESERMGRAGYVRYQNFFTKEKWYESMQKIHREILSFK